MKINKKEKSITDTNIDKHVGISKSKITNTKIFKGLEKYNHEKQ